jgi:hypothetical protein
VSYPSAASSTHAARLAPKWALRNFEDFHRNFTGILEDGEWNFDNTACISDV